MQTHRDSLSDAHASTFRQMKESLINLLPDEIVGLIVLWWQELERRRLALLELRRAINRARNDWTDRGGNAIWGSGGFKPDEYGPGW